MFCHNFSSSRGNWTPCHFCVCAKCYEAPGDLPFPVNRAFNDESVYFKRRKEDVNKYLSARRGEWILSPFQCDECWFVNLHGRKPLLREYLDRQELKFIRRANLDMLWSRKAATVRGIVDDVKDIIRRVGWRDRSLLLARISPWPLIISCSVQVLVQQSNVLITFMKCFSA